MIALCYINPAELQDPKADSAHASYIKYNVFQGTFIEVGPSVVPNTARFASFLGRLYNEAASNTNERQTKQQQRQKYGSGFKICKLRFIDHLITKIDIIGEKLLYGESSYLHGSVVLNKSSGTLRPKSKK